MKCLKIDTLEKGWHDKDQLLLHAAFQILTYCLILSKETGNNLIQPGIYYLKELFSDNFDARLSLKPDKEIKLDSYSQIENEFETILGELLSQIFDPGLPFIQTNKIKTCEKCEFASVCHKD